MNVSKFIILCSLFLLAWLTATYFYEAPQTHTTEQTTESEVEITKEPQEKTTELITAAD